MNTDSKALFNELLHRLCKYEDCKYSDAMLLHYLLRQGADGTEFKTTAVKVALDALHGCINRRDVQRSVERLTKLELISTRVHANTRTHFSVNRQAVLALLEKPLPRNLPGIDERHFPFLDEWESLHSDAPSAHAANESTVGQEGNPVPQTPNA
ncbi:hypothetical protein [Hydrogenophaga flava]|uniref:hypothetical protein n=1 Tax=Hydrogenophaga flava TaxID=65657 RepID=UPI000AD81D4B|nr:hypothetical protein [Hydrogenophaga flava]